MSLRRASSLLLKRAAVARTVTLAPSRAAHVLLSDNIDPVCADIFAEKGHDVDFITGLPEDELCEIIGKYDGLVVRSATTVTEKILEAGKNLKVIGRAGVGVDNIDIPCATKKGVLVMNTPEGNTVSTAQLAISLLCALARNIPEANATMRNGEWARSKFMGTEMSGKTMAIIGCGRIGRTVASWGKALNMRVVGFDPVISPAEAKAEGIELMELADIWGLADFISLHTPLTPATRNMLNDETLALCKDGVRIVNCARGGIIEEGALLRALDSGKVGGAAMDVYEVEPPAESSYELLRHPKVVCTPHLGASTDEAQVNVARDIALQMSDTLDGKAYKGVMNASHLSLSTVPNMQPFMALGELLGKLAVQLSPGTIDSVNLKTWGGRDISITSNAARDLILAMVQKGILEHHERCEPVPNLVSSPYLAGVAGITSAVEDKMPSLVGLPYANLVTLTVGTTSGNSYNFTGSVFGTEPNIVQIGEHTSFQPFSPSGCLLKFHNHDRPGELAKILSVLEKHSINVGRMTLGNRDDSGRAIGLLSCDQFANEQVVAELEAAGVTEVQSCTF